MFSGLFWSPGQLSFLEVSALPASPSSMSSARGCSTSVIPNSCPGHQVPGQRGRSESQPLSLVLSGFRQEDSTLDLAVELFKAWSVLWAGVQAQETHGAFAVRWRSHGKGKKGSRWDLGEGASSRLQDPSGGQQCWRRAHPAGAHPAWSMHQGCVWVLAGSSRADQCQALQKSAPTRALAGLDDAASQEKGMDKAGLLLESTWVNQV